jgi:hypothetical protein
VLRCVGREFALKDGPPGWAVGSSRGLLRPGFRSSAAAAARAALAVAVAPLAPADAIAPNDRDDKHGTKYHRSYQQDRQLKHG